MESGGEQGPRVPEPEAGTGEPLYLWLAGLLRAEIDAGTLAPHDPVPSERTLSERHGISRMTIRHAVQHLVSEGYLYRRERHGTFVTDPRIRVSVGSFTRAVTGEGRRPGAKVLEATTVRAEDQVARGLGVPAGTDVFYLRRLRSVEDEPVAVERIYLDPRRFPGLLAEDLSSSLWEVLEKGWGVVASRADARVEAVPLGQAEADLLGLPAGCPAMQLTRTVFDRTGQVVEVARDVYRGDRAGFHVTAPVTAMRHRARRPAEAQRQ